MMDKKYRKILEKALPYYEQGRKGDIQHVKWLANIVLRYADSKVNKDVLMGLVILHDIGYSKVKGNPFNLKVRRKHQDEGAKIAGKVLKELGWKKEKVLRVQMLVKKHDDWHSWKKVEPELKLFHNFDFMWMASKKGYDIVRKFVNK
ncbi:HD domain-containing protein, partial [Candidatus Woesearchaeota archaeon]|nr:HD domain-containing protein [Candidatus Woesearchaeota archaeon]